ncbi:hypothetical protein ACWEGX_01760 [Streptomyces chartreusis]|uniref:hypothetical protein n=1 Tax=Streptomyces TaxID=1883 RepID=UPI00163C3739|nr:hypothetical protein [Streptomyces sp. WAC 01325]WCH93900.1 hypothetical protein POD33_17935 [Streptomyces moderatus]
MKRSSGVRVAATVAVSALSLALVTGCGGDSGGSDAKALSAAELKKSIIAQGDVEGYKVDASGKQLPKSKDQVKSGEEKCAPLAYAMGGQAPGEAASETSVMVTQEKKKPTDGASKLEDLTESEIEDSITSAMDMTLTVVGLSSYDGDGAAETFKSVSDAVESCSGGFPVTMQGTDQKVTGIAAEKGSGSGDESVGFTAKSDAEDGDVATTHVEVVRHGSTIATYYTMNLGLMITDKPYDVPAAVIDAQSAKLK